MKSKTARIVGILLSLALMLGMMGALSATAYADDYDLWIGGVQVTSANADEWQLDRTSIEAYLSAGTEDLIVTSEDSENEFSASSSDPGVVYAETSGGGWIHLYYQGVGEATVTVTDKHGRSAVCKVTVRPDPISFGENASIRLNSYENDACEDIEYRLETNGDNIISSVRSSNTKVVKAVRIKDTGEGYADCYLRLTPVGAGTAAVTATDQYGQTAAISIAVTQRYIDESRYLDALERSSVCGGDGDFTYGETSLRCWCEIRAQVYTTINGKKYTGRVDPEGCYIISGIPWLAAGKKITVTFQAGQAKYNCIVTVRKKHGASLPVLVTTQTYSGKRLTPAVTITYGRTVLKKGTDYTVAYSANRNVGKAKAAITFRSNYTGAKAVYFKIVPGPTKIARLKKGKKSFEVKWKARKAQTTGYEIQYSTNKSFRSARKTVRIKGRTKVSKKIKGLKKKKTYYVRVRTYKTVGKTDYYSRWSPAKAVKTR